MRRRIGFKLAAIWLAVAVPLSIVLFITYYQWYSARVSLVEQQRIGYAQLSGTAFRLLISEVQQTMRLTGLDIAEGKVSSAASMLQLRRVSASYPAAYLVFTDPKGRVLAATRKHLVGQDLAVDPAFQLALHTPSGDAIEPSQVEVGGQIGFDVAERIDGAGGRPIGVMLMLIDVRKLHQAFPVQVPVGGISVIDSAGQVVFQSEDLGFALRRERWTDHFPFVRRALEGHVASTRDFRFPLGGRRIGAFVPIEPFGWAAGSSVDANVALAPLYRSLLIALPVALAVAALGLTVSIGIAWGIRRSLGRLADDAGRIGRGDLEQPISTEREDEIADVARSLENARLSLDRYARESAQLFQQQRQEADLDSALADIYSILHSTLNFREILYRVLERAAGAIGCDAAGINLREEGYWVRVALYGLSEEHVGEKLTDDQNKVAALAGKTAQPVIITDTSSDPRIERRFAERYGVKSTMVFPLISRDEVVGVVFFDYHSAPVAFTNAQVDFASKLGHSLSLAYENSRLYAAEHNIAETLQTALLALPDRVPGLEFAHAYRSATQAARVGGDFYDLFELEHGILGLTVGDISGHGIDAAVLTSLVKSTIRATATDQRKTPADVMETANKVLFRSSRPELFATVFFGLLDSRDGRLVYCNAGHTTGACICLPGGLTQLEANSPLVGAFSEGAFTDSELRLARGDLLFLYTDGLIEARRDGELFSEKRLFDLLSKQKGDDPSAAVKKVVGEVLSFTGGELSDDLAILALTRTE